MCIQLLELQIEANERSPVHDSVIEYLSDQQCSRQWKLFLRVWAEELSSQWTLAEFQNFMGRLGTRFARQIPIGPCQTLDDLQLAMSRVWMDADWGWVALEQQQDHLRIRHFCAPLRAALGDESSVWSPAFLEGVYQEWFAQTQAGETLRVSQVTAPDAAGSVEFQLARA